MFGLAGTRKTTFAESWGSQTELLDIDRGCEVGMSVQDKWKDERVQTEVKQFWDVNPDSPSAWSGIKNRIYDISAECQTQSYKKKVLVLDSLTSMGEHALRYVLKNSNALPSRGDLKTKAVEIQHWGLAMNEIENVMMVVRSLPVAVLICCHVLTTQMEEGQVHLKPWVIGSKLPDKLPQMFNEIWYARLLAGGGNVYEAVLQTQASSNVLARTRGGLPDNFNMGRGLKEALTLIKYNTETTPVPVPSTPVATQVTQATIPQPQGTTPSK
jgi:hypothetical protein